VLRLDGVWVLDVFRRSWVSYWWVVPEWGHVAGGVYPRRGGGVAGRGGGAENSAVSKRGWVGCCVFGVFGGLWVGGRVFWIFLSPRFVLLQPGGCGVLPGSFVDLGRFFSHPLLLFPLLCHHLPPPPHAGPCSAWWGVVVGVWFSCCLVCFFFFGVFFVSGGCFVVAVGFLCWGRLLGFFGGVFFLFWWLCCLAVVFLCSFYPLPSIQLSPPSPPQGYKVPPGFPLFPEGTLFDLWFLWGILAY